MMCFIAFVVGLVLGGIVYRWFGDEIEEILGWMFSGKGGK